MTAGRWREAKAILSEALDEPSPEKRLELVRYRCGDDAELFHELVTFLNQTTSTIDSLAEKAGARLRRELTPLTAGERIGSYAIVRELGRGGMGVVYLAKRADGTFEKEVAIKVLKRGTDTDEVLRRFDAERQILARLVHPNIARLLDAGTTDDGLPYFVMEYVVGQPITVYAQEHELSFRERLELFRVVCSAVSYAHQNLVVHRDLKPRNVLVTEKADVRLLDFGIAKLLDDSSPDLTLTIQRRLTPTYASPEQVKGEPVTTVSDVYSLGVLLYELVTDARPYILKTNSTEELTRAICEQEPQRPSSALFRSQKSDVRNQKLLRGDLDDIILKALRKDPSRRYSSVDQLSEDIRRHVQGLPVRARKGTASYRAAKFIRRHKTAVVAAVLVSLALVGATIATTWEAVRARKAQALAEQRFEEVRKLAHSVLFNYHDQIAALPGSTKVREQLVKDSLRYLDELRKQAADNRALLRELAAAYEKIAFVQGGAATNSTGLLASSNLGDTAGANVSLLKALAIRERLARNAPDDRSAQNELAYCYAALAGINLVAGPPEKVIDYNNKALQILEASLNTDAHSEVLASNLTGIYVGMAKAYGVAGVANLGRTTTAIHYMEKAQALCEQLIASHPDEADYKVFLASIHNTLGFLSSSLGHTEEELDHDNKAAEIDRQLMQRDPTNTLYRRELAIQLGNAGTAMLRTGDRAGALPKMQEALELYQALAAADPDDISIRRNLAVGHRNVAAALDSAERETALQHFHTALDIFTGLAAKDPKNTDYQRQLAICYLYQARYLSQTQHFDAATRSDEEGIKVEERLVAAAPNNASARSTLAQLTSDLGREQQLAGHLPEAKSAYQKSLAIYLGMNQNGTLAPADRNKPDEVRARLAECDSRP